MDRVTEKLGPRLLITTLAVLSLVVAACGAAASTPDPVTTLVIRLNPSNANVAIAQEEGLFEDLNIVVDYTKVGYGESAALFIASDDPIGHESPWEVAKFINEGEDLVFFSTSSALNFWNGLIIRDADAATYTKIEDLYGKKLGHPGFGTGTWAAFEILMKSIYDVDARTSFELVEADPGALLGFLSTGEIEGTLNFAGQAATAMASDEFDLLFSFSQEWMEAEGYPLTINGLIARRDWIENNTDVARRFVEGSERGLQWMKDNPDELRPGGKYADWVAGEGWHRDDATLEFILGRLQTGEWYLSHDDYTQGWIDSVYKFVEQAGDDVPAKDQVFFPPERLSGG